MQKFSEMGLADPIQKAIDELGFLVTTPIQEKTIPRILNSSQDLIALAQTGTGKTASYGLPIIQNTNVADRHIQGLVLSPTRELCIQISNDLNSFSKYSEGLKVIPVYGGAPIDKQIQALKHGAHLVVGTPGRVKDMIERGLLKIQDIRCRSLF